MEVHAQLAVRISAYAALLLSLPNFVYAQGSVELATSRHWGDHLNAVISEWNGQYTGEWFGEKGSGNTTSIGFKNSLAQLSLTKNDVTDRLTEASGSVKIAQNFGPLTRSEISTGYSNGVTQNRFESVTLGHWWNQGTLLTDLMVTQSRTTRSNRDYLDTDGLRVLVPERISGRSYRLSSIWLARPDLFFQGSFNTIFSSDRPRTFSETLEARYFLAATSTAVHIGGEWSDDQNDVERNTDYGKISSRGLSSAVYQNLSDHWIVGLALRRAWEQEIPRSSESQKITRKTDEQRASIRYRFINGPVTEDVPELYSFVGQYFTNTDMGSTKHFGLGGKYVF